MDSSIRRTRRRLRTRSASRTVRGDTTRRATQHRNRSKRQQRRSDMGSTHHRQCRRLVQYPPPAGINRNLDHRHRCRRRHLPSHRSNSIHRLPSAGRIRQRRRRIIVDSGNVHDHHTTGGSPEPADRCHSDTGHTNPSHDLVDAASRRNRRQQLQTAVAHRIGRMDQRRSCHVAAHTHRTGSSHHLPDPSRVGQHSRIVVLDRRNVHDGVGAVRSDAVVRECVGAEPVVDSRHGDHCAGAASSVRW